MPQFDSFAFGTNTVYFIFSFIFLYFFLVKHILAAFAVSLKFRQKKMQKLRMESATGGDPVVAVLSIFRARYFFPIAAVSLYNFLYLLKSCLSCFSTISGARIMSKNVFFLFFCDVFTLNFTKTLKAR